MPEQNNKGRNIRDKEKANYSGVHNMYEGVHREYSGVYDEYEGVGMNMGDDKEPIVAPGMRDFIQEDANKEEVKKDDFTKVTTLSYDETH